MNLTNFVLLKGNLGADLEDGITEAGAVYARAQLATAKVWYDQNHGKMEKTTWHSLVWWGKSAEAATKYLGKGDRILIQGEIEKVKSKDNIWYTNIKVSEWELLNSKRKKDEATGY